MSASSRQWKGIGVVLLSLVGLMGLCILAVHGVHRVNPKHIESEISQSLPLGVDETSVLVFLNERKIRHSDYLPEYHRIYAEIDHSTVGLIKGHIHIEFNFDDHGKLLNCEVKELFDSL